VEEEKSHIKGGRGGKKKWGSEWKNGEGGEPAERRGGEGSADELPLTGGRFFRTSLKEIRGEEKHGTIQSIVMSNGL